MKSFDILVDGRLIQSDLIVVNLPLRNDIAVYSWLNIDSKLINHIIAEKAAFPADGTGSVALNANVDNVVTKYEIVDAYPVMINSSAEFDSVFMIWPDGSKIEIQQDLQEVSQKIERVSSPISIGADDMLMIMPLKSIGRIENAVALGVGVSEIKNAIIDGEDSFGDLTVDASLVDPLVMYYEEANSNIVPGAYVQSLSYLMHMRLIKNGVNVGADVIDFDLYRSLGRLSARIATGADASFAVEFFIRTDSQVELISDADVLSRKFVDSESDVALDCIGSAVLRRLRLLSEIDNLGTLADVDEMMLEDMCYIGVEE